MEPDSASPSSKGSDPKTASPTITSQKSASSLAAFTGKAAGYDRFRPDYPPALIDYVLDAARVSPNATIADIGAGTGILTQELARTGRRIVAVEPNVDMLEQARRRLATGGGNGSGQDATSQPVVDGQPSASGERQASTRATVRFVQAPAEKTGLAAASVDLVTVAQAFHWFDREAFRAECARILKPGGHVALIWNSRVADDPANREAEAVNRSLCPRFKGFSGGAGSDPAAFADFFEGGILFRLFPHDLPYDEEGFVGRNLSASYAPRAGDPAFDEYVRRMRGIFHRYAKDGVLTMRNATRLYLGTVPQGAPGVSIRRMRLADYEEVHALWLSCPGMGLNDVDDACDGICRLLDRNPTTCLVACEGGSIVGVILAGTDGRRAYVYHTAVRPSHQGRGIGRALVEAELEAIRALGISKVALVVFKRNAAGNAFWERMGFTLREDIAYRNRALRELVRIDT